jgi:phytoene desaturase
VKKAVVIGAGFSGLSAASFLAKDGWEVTVLEKHAGPGGRARNFKAQGFTFDMGPSWYWMPDVFERYFNCFGKKVSDYYQLQRLDPSYRVYWSDGNFDLPSIYPELRKAFEKIEPGAAKQLDRFMQEAAYKYQVGIGKLVFKPGRSVREYLDWEVIKGVVKLDVFSNMKKHIHGFFKDPRIRQLLEFPVLFLGALPEDIPALYSLMNYADIEFGTWYPHKGMYEIVEGMYALARELGVRFQFNADVNMVEISDDRITTIRTADGKTFTADVIVGAADYAFIDQKLLPASHREYSNSYWESRVMAPSCLLYYVGVNKRLDNIKHHSLFFDTDFTVHGKEIYESKTWPKDPLFYTCAPSVTDDTVAPPGCENLFFLIPVSSGLKGDTEELRNAYFEKILKRFEEKTGNTVKPHIIFQKSYAVSDFELDYNSFKGNAYGLANTLMQTAILKPRCKSSKIKNLFYTGQLTVPGPGLPPSLISGEVISSVIQKEFS